ncbi:2Fe-2S iron-sulfur cluster-binding protein [Neisseria wadsworthii]|uniref:Ferredoxin n=1 Tax=Neisseria wadsworthii 9715 TaxID=1030841 RepID=G4CN79_9NEIS|nr:2Fe-2S iron-sulfur cluster-binding protein [Neisseria wadsworthii]EGZ49893.1 ferredoxin [Neisseria wadsworthii 9715]QMT36529.1 2Fe-2S iron-sulfur cluster binding domain-containing protein [Neisseria wadsworthii]
MGYTVCIKDPSGSAACTRSITVYEGQTLLAASEQMGQHAISVGCRGGGCGVCRIRILSGCYRKKAMSKTHINEQDLAEGVVLACRVFPESDMEIVSEPPPPPYNPFI